MSRLACDENKALPGLETGESKRRRHALGLTSPCGPAGEEEPATWSACCADRRRRARWFFAFALLNIRQPPVSFAERGPNDGALPAAGVQSRPRATWPSRRKPEST